MKPGTAHAHTYGMEPTKLEIDGMSMWNADRRTFLALTDRYEKVRLQSKNNCSLYSSKNFQSILLN